MNAHVLPFLQSEGHPLKFICKHVRCAKRQAETLFSDGLRSSSTPLIDERDFVVGRYSSVTVTVQRRCVNGNDANRPAQRLMIGRRFRAESADIANQI